MARRHRSSRSRKRSSEVAEDYEPDQPEEKGKGRGVRAKVSDFVVGYILEPESPTESVRCQPFTINQKRRS